MTELLNSVWGPIVRTIHAHHGDILNFAGDAVIVVFAPPVRQSLPDSCVLLGFFVAMVLCLLQHVVMEGVKHSG